MTDKTEDLEIEITDDAPAPVGDPAVATAAPATVEADDAIKKLRADLEADNARLKAEADAANRRAAAAEGTAVQAQTAAQQSDLQLITGAIEQVKTTASVLQRNYAEAAASGDWEATAKIQWEMSEAAANLKQLEQGKASLEAAPKPSRQTAPVSDPVEAIATQLSPRSAQWVRSHPNFVTDTRLNRKLLAAHNLAEADGFPLDSDEYFASVERTLGITLPGEKVIASEPSDDPMSGASAPSARSAPPPSAPVNRANGKSTVRLTAAEVEAAELSGMTTQEYAAQKIRIEREKSGASLN